MPASPDRRDALTPAMDAQAAPTITPVDSESAHFDAALTSMSRRALAYEHQIKDLEARLTVDMSNSRAIDTLLQEVLSGLKQDQLRAEKALVSTVPHIENTLQENLDALASLDEILPQVGKQVHDIRHVYDRGRSKAQDLVAALEWLNLPISLRLRTIIFTSDAPVSARWKFLIRTLFAIALLSCIWIAWITLRGAVRAHRQRLVWGERLMS